MRNYLSILAIIISLLSITLNVDANRMRHGKPSFILGRKA